MEKAIEIKRRAQRCVQNGDLDGALAEYEKLVAVVDSDPYNFVLLADLLYKKGETGQASQRYLAAATAYETHGLFKNAIAVCKKMMRLSLAPLEVLERLANLHTLDGLATESALYSVQYADLLLSQNEVERAIVALEKAYAVAPDNLKSLEKLGEARLLLGEPEQAARTLHEASRQYERVGQLKDAARCRRRAEQLMPGHAGALDDPPAAAPGSAAETDAPPELESSSDLESSDLGPGPPLELDDHMHLGARDSGEPLGPPALHGYREDLAAAQPAAAVATEAVPAPAAEPVPTASAPVSPPRLSIALSPEGAPAHESSSPATEEGPSGNGAGEAEPAKGETPESPGLSFEAATRAPAPKPGKEPASLAHVERLLAEAQESFRTGEREAASRALAGAALAYEAIGRLDSAATIYRSLGKSAHATHDVLMQWFANCERRGDHAEAAQVACELGDRALNEGDSDDALGWFQRAQSLDAQNELARRRLQRLAPAPAPGAVATLTEAAPEAQPAPAEAAGTAGAAAPSVAATGAGPKPATGMPEPGRVEVAVGRGEAVTFDLGALIGEFQRGVEAQLSGDAQSHYDLGMAYREMGLLEQALDSFRVAGQDPVFRERVIEMVGRCLLDQGCFDDATQAFEEALADASRDPAHQVSVRFLLGLAHEAAGRSAEALGEFERVYAAQPSFPDVAQKIRVLRKTMENL